MAGWRTSAVADSVDDDVAFRYLIEDEVGIRNRRDTSDRRIIGWRANERKLEK